MYLCGWFWLACVPDYAEKKTLILLFLGTLCYAPIAGVNTAPVDSSNYIPAETVYNYTCMVGYETEDSLSTVCTDNGTWSLPPPNCTGII